MNNITVFENVEFGQVRTITIDGEPWFVAKDVAIALGYKNYSTAIDRHCEGVVKQETLQTAGGMQNISIIPEKGIYRLIMRSKLPNAIKFQDWVCDEVLPSIKKHGAYLTPSKTEELLANPDLIIQLATELKNTRLAKQEAENKLVEVAPKLEYYQNVLESESEFTTTQIAKELFMSAKQLNIILSNEGIQFKQNGQWLLYSKYQDKGYTKTRTIVYNDTKGETNTKHTTVWTERGREFIHDLIESI